MVKKAYPLEFVRVLCLKFHRLLKVKDHLTKAMCGHYG